MKKSIILGLMLFSLNCLADEPKKSMMFKRKEPNREIDLRINKPSETRTNGFLTLASGIMFTSIGIALEKQRIKDNIPDGYHGYSKANNIAFNYSVIGIGVGLSVTGGIIIFKAKN
jgi:hypothetical protein